MGNITKITNDGETVAEYTYDDQGQLSSETIVSENVRYNYFYDTYGNLASAHKYNLTTGAYISSDYYGYGSWGYGDENGWHDRLTSFNGGSITYDTIGNPLSYYNGKDAYYFVWQNGRELASASYGHSTVYYKYGADGLRVQKTVDGAVHDYYYSDGLLVREVITYGYGYVEILDFLYDESGTPYSFIYGFVNSGNVYTTQYYYVKNLQNDVIAIVDEYGNMAAEYTYDAWGNVLYINEYLHDCIGAINPIRYRSYYQDTETGFYYLQTRYYDPAIRRFINEDRYINANGNILGFNMYAYCGNNPVMYVDYSGEDAGGATIWTSTMWGLTCIDGFLPIGDIIYGVGIIFCMFAINANKDDILTYPIVFDSGDNSIESPSNSTDEPSDATEIGDDALELPNQGKVTAIPGAPPVDAGAQGKHVIGHNNNKDPNRSTWKPGENGVRPTQEAWGNSRPHPKNPNVRFGTSGDGRTIKIHVTSNGVIHGYPIFP